MNIRPIREDDIEQVIQLSRQPRLDVQLYRNLDQRAGCD